MTLQVTKLFEVLLISLKKMSESGCGNLYSFSLIITHACSSQIKVPLQAWSGPEGSRNLMFPDFMTTTQDGGKVVSFTHRPPLPLGNAPGTHFS